MKQIKAEPKSQQLKLEIMLQLLSVNSMKQLQ